MITKSIHSKLSSIDTTFKFIKIFSKTLVFPTFASVKTIGNTMKGDFTVYSIFTLEKSQYCCLISIEPNTNIGKEVLN